jgi:hypothetical protein
VPVSWTWKIPYRKFFKFTNSAIDPHSEQTLQDERRMREELSATCFGAWV